MSKSFCYKTLETYDLPKNQLKSFCTSGSNSGYYNISNTHSIYNDRQLRTRENYRPIWKAKAWQQPAGVSPKKTPKEHLDEISDGPLKGEKLLAAHKAMKKIYSL